MEFSTWQDWVLAWISVVFIIALIPSIRSVTDKPPISTSLLTGTLLIATALVEMTLNLWFGSITTFAGGIAWYILAYQKVEWRKNS